MRQRPFFTSGEAYKSAGVLDYFPARNISFAFRRAQFHFRDQAAKILIAFARFHEQGVTPAGGGSDFCANVSANLTFIRGQIKTRSAVNSIAIEQSHRLNSILGAPP